jgi:iron(III) transport system ATP-binding protein
VALDRVSLEVQTGELFFLLGPSGCGKTTLLRILAGLETPDSGTIRFDGRDIADLAPHERGAPMVFQNYALWPHLSVRDNVAFGLVERRVRRAEIERRVAEALREVGLGALGGRMPGQLSGGQQQRVVLARALVLQPRIILLDEPLSNLDAKLRMEMRDELARLHAQTPVTFVYVTHDQVEALSLADRMAVLEAGRVRAVGPPRALYHRPPNAFCADFLGEANLLPARVAGREGAALRIETPLGAWQAVSGAEAAPMAGARGSCLIRPENLEPVSGPATGWNTFEATVVHCRMNGSTVTAFLDAGGTPLKAALLNRGSLSLEAGQRLRWGADQPHTVFVPGEDGER